jgi:hypothetical protein
LEAAVKRIGPLHLLAVLGLVALCATVANAGARCSDEPEACVKSSASLSRPVARVTASEPAPRVQPTVQPASAPALVAKKATAPARKPVAKVQRTAPTPGMGMLLKLSNGTSSDVSWLPTHASETQRHNNDKSEKSEAQGQSWVL